MALHTHVRLARLIRDFNLSVSQHEKLISCFSSQMAISGGEWLVEQSCANEILKKVYEWTAPNIRGTTYTLPSWLQDIEKGWPHVLKSIYSEPSSSPASVSPAQGELLRSLVYNIAPKNIVEIGCFLGVSTLWMASALKDIGNGIVHSIDVFLPKFPYLPHHYSCIVDPYTRIESAISDAGVENHVNLISKDSKEAYFEVKGALGDDKIDILFVDGDHTKNGCLQDFSIYRDLLSAGSYIILHDIYPEVCGHEGPRYLIDEFINDGRDEFECVEIATFPHNFGMACIRKK
ncbi:TPA: O-methyltransferase [Aeromonas veronii]